MSALLLHRVLGHKPAVEPTEEYPLPHHGILRFQYPVVIAHAGIFNTESQYLETEEMWFANWDLGGPFWDKGNPVAQRTFSQSPVRVGWEL